MIRLGLIGVGFMGWIHYLAYKKVAGLQLAAVSTRDPKRLAGDWRDIKGNFGPPGEQVDLSDVAKYSDWRELLANPEIDVVDICLPPYLHAEVTIAALEAGKHVLCEKPLALTINECDRMVETARRAKRSLFTAHVLPFLPEYAYAREINQSGRFGKLLGGNFRRVISDPTWLADFYDLRKVGGPLLDLHVHDAHFIRYLFGMPSEVVSCGRCRGETVSYCDSIFRFPHTDFSVSSTTGVIGQQGRGFMHGFEIHWEQATLAFQLSVTDSGLQSLPLTLYRPDGKAEQPALPAGDPMLYAFERELGEVMDCLREGRESRLLGGDLARDAIVICQAEADAVHARSTIRIENATW